MGLSKSAISRVIIGVATFITDLLSPRGLQVALRKSSKKTFAFKEPETALMPDLPKELRNSFTWVSKNLLFWGLYLEIRAHNLLFCRLWGYR